MKQLSAKRVVHNREDRYHLTSTIFT